MTPIFATGKHLAAARALAGLTQRDLAERSGLHCNSVKYHERKRGVVEGHAPERFAKALAELGVIVGIKHGHAVLQA